MRLIAIPLARARPSAQPVSTFIAQRIAISAPNAASDGKASPSSSASASSPPQPTSATTKPTLSSRVLTKASDFWLSLGRDGADGGKVALFDWKRRTYSMGEKLMDRIEYEEWALKALDPALGPSLTKGAKAVATMSNNSKGGDEEQSSGAAQSSGSTSGSDEAAAQRSQISAPSRIALLYPSTMLCPTSLLTSLRTLTSHRTPHHRSRMLYCIVGMPLTIPFMLIPVIPNLPFFYLVWRAYSHWKAWKSSEYLGEMLLQGRVETMENGELDTILSAAPKQIAPVESEKQGPSSSSSASSPSSAKAASPSSTASLLLSQSKIQELRKAFTLDDQSVIELKRALQQTEASVERGEWDKVQKAAAP